MSQGRLPEPKQFVVAVDSNCLFNRGENDNLFLKMRSEKV